MTPPLIEMRELLKRAADLVDALDHEGLFGDEVAEFYAALEAEQRVGVVPEDCVVVPKEPSDALLRPFYECPPDELGLAWSAMQRIAGKNATLPTLTPQRLAELQANERRLDAVFARCTVIYWPPSNPPEYPLEHNPHANKDMRRQIIAAIDASGREG